ncbi:MAG: hypothetical protein M1541_21000, partial [Acidobacteria bacterium]|nr:hypothetical protein [Acidobacteriota bacterium]
STFEHARLAPASQMRLLRHSGKQIVDLEGDDFEFVNKVEIVKKGDKYGKPASVPFSLPKGLRGGPQDRLEMEIDTSGLDTGVYQVLLKQLDGNARPVEVRVLEEPPAIAGLPLVANTGETRQVVALRGKGLGRITGIEATGAGIELEAAAATGDRRTMQVRLNPDARQGSKLDLRVRVRDYPEPLVLRGALEVAGPRPRILEATLAPPSGLEIALRPKEIPAGVYADVMMRTRGLRTDSRVEIGCKGGASAPFQARIGESAGGLRTQRTGNDSLFLSFDPAPLPADCTASATVDNGREGASDPFDLGRVIRIPHIQSFVLTSEAAGDNAYVGVLTGHDLELIEKTGWDAANGLPVLGLPTTTTGEGRTQSLKIRLPWPSPAPHSPLYIWLRGEPQGRATTVKY